jgi:DNA polymerase-3 subunit epsilon
MYCGIDFEGSGSSKDFPDDPIQIGLAVLDPQPDLFESYLQAGHPSTFFAYRTHKIPLTKTQNAPHLRDLYPEFMRRAQRNVLVAHNAATEKRHLRAAFPLLPPLQWIDTLNVMRGLFPTWESHGLEACCENLELLPKLKELLPHKTWHDALFDAAASALLFQWATRKFPDWKLHHFQTLSSKEWKKHHKPKYIRSHGKIITTH